MSKSLPARRRRAITTYGLFCIILLIPCWTFWQFRTMHHIGTPIAALDSSSNNAVSQRLTQFDPNIPVRNDNNSTFSACLLVSDDNHYLVEWLAYHYTTLPLRYLVITRDPRSRTSPKAILDRWEAHNLTIVRWNDRRFLPKEWLNRFPAENDPVGKLMKHRERQRNFYPACFEHLRQAGREWVMVIDVDEFAVQNQHYKAIQRNYSTLLEAIQDQHPYNMENASCITMPRLRFGNFESETMQPKLTPYLFRDQDFLTYRFRWRAGLLSRADNRHPKSTIHVGRIPTFSRQDTDAHRPVRSACPKRNMYIANPDSPFVVHHYVGSREQFQFRKDARDGTDTRGDERLESYGKLANDYDTGACNWLDEFIRQVGFEAARDLLQDVGSLAYSNV